MEDDRDVRVRFLSANETREAVQDALGQTQIHLLFFSTRFYDESVRSQTWHRNKIDVSGNFL